MDITVSNGKIQIQNDNNGHVNSLSAYICKPDRSILCRISGIERFFIKAKFNDISEIQFNVSKYIIGEGSLKTKINPCYKYINAFYGIYVPELGQYGYFRINEEPNIVAKSTKQEVKSFTAYSYESILQYENLVGFLVNQGTKSSLEMFDDNLDSIGAPINTIQFYNPSEPKLSLLDLVLTDDYYGWTIGEVDESLSKKKRAFSIDNQNVYSFLHSDVSKAFRCIFDFDTINKKINAYDIETVGRNTNIYLSFEHFIQQINISPQNDEIYTVFNVAGDNDLDISSVNFGSNKVFNLGYPLTFLDEDIQLRYYEYMKYREGLRVKYAEDALQYAKLLAQKSSIEDRQPQEAIDNNWASTTYYKLDDLRNYLSIYRQAVAEIESLFTVNNQLNEEALQISKFASMYYSYKNVAIPDLIAEIAKRESGTTTPAETVDADVEWDLYGLYDLETKRANYTELVKKYEELNYDADSWDISLHISEETWTEHHNDWIKYKDYIDVLDAMITEKKAKIEEIKNAIEEVLGDMHDLADAVSFDTYFSDDPSIAKVLRSLFKESDYSDDNYLIVDSDDEGDIIEEANRLYDAAVERLNIESHPQLSWEVQSDNLYAVKAFERLRDSLQVGDFVNLNYSFTDTTLYGETDNYIFKTEDGTYLMRTQDDESYIINEESMWFLQDNYKFRVVEIDFDGLDIDNDDFTLTFSDFNVTTTSRDDFEYLLNDFVSSKTNSIKASINSTINDTINSATRSLVRPLMSSISGQINAATLGDTDLSDLVSINSQIVATNEKIGFIVTADELRDITATGQTLGSKINELSLSADGLLYSASQSLATIDNVRFQLYSDAVTYSIGDIVIYGGKYYRCTSSSTGHLPTDETHWMDVSDKYTIEKVTTAVNTISADALGTLAIVSDAPTEKWKGNKYYAVGDLVWYNNSLYRCVYSHLSSDSVAPPLDENKWSKAVNGSIIEMLSDGITLKVQGTSGDESSLNMGAGVLTLQSSDIASIIAEKELILSGGSVKIGTSTTGVLEINSPNFTLTSDGTVTANNGTFAGTINGSVINGSKITTDYKAGSKSVSTYTNSVTTKSSSSKEYSSAEAYDSTKVYKNGEVVIYNGGYYEVINGDVANIAPTNTTYWKRVTEASSTSIKNISLSNYYVTLRNSSDTSVYSLSEDGLSFTLKNNRGNVVKTGNISGVRDGWLIDSPLYITSNDGKVGHPMGFYYDINSINDHSFNGVYNETSDTVSFFIDNNVPANIKMSDVTVDELYIGGNTFTTGKIYTSASGDGTDYLAMPKILKAASSVIHTGTSDTDITLYFVPAKYDIYKIAVFITNGDYGTNSKQMGSTYIQLSNRSVHCKIESALANDEWYRYNYIIWYWG